MSDCAWRTYLPVETSLWHRLSRQSTKCEISNPDKYDLRQSGDWSGESCYSIDTNIICLWYRLKNMLICFFFFRLNQVFFPCLLIGKGSTQWRTFWLNWRKKWCLLKIGSFLNLQKVCQCIFSVLSEPIFMLLAGWENRVVGITYFVFRQWRCEGGSQGVSAQVLYSLSRRKTLCMQVIMYI